MSAAVIGGAASSAGRLAKSEPTGFAALNSAEFIRVLMSELSNQDPFKPQDSSALLEQLSSLRNIESQLGLQKSMESLVLQNSLSSASGLIGKDVVGLDQNNDEITGTVQSVRVENGKAVLELNSGKLLPVENVRRIMLGSDAAASSLMGPVSGASDAVLPTVFL
jgi:flagellar basal-body rod modification protein FlgD